MGYHKGDVFEEIIKMSSLAYERKGITVIKKISTPMQPIRRGNQIISAYYEEKSTVDFIGICNGHSIAFDAKETIETTKFPLSNIKDHQVEFLEAWYRHKGKAFMIINFKKLDKVYRLDITTLSWYWKQYKENKGKRGFGSIPLSEFEANCKEIVSKNGILLDYLDGLEVKG